ncbi:MAG: mechanosensitive ion channel domain-containing protein, partial [Acidobacteriota bacterium]
MSDVSPRPAHSWRELCRLFLLAGLFAAVGFGPVAAQEPSTDEPAPAATDVAPEPVPDTLRSAQATMRTFLEAFDESKAPAGLHPLDVAAATLDLSNVDPGMRQQVGRNLASQLKEVLDKTELIDIEALPDSTEASAWRLDIGGGLAVVLDAGSDGAWRFTAQTLDQMPALLAEVSERQTVEGVENVAPTTLPQWIRAQMPKGLLGVSFLIEDWQWLGLLFLIVFGILLDRMVTAAIRSAIRRALDARMERLEPGMIRQALRPVGLLVASLFWWLGILWLGLPPQILSVLAVAVKFIAVTSFAWSAYRVVDIITAVLDLRAQRSENKFDDLLVPLVRKTSKVIIAAVGFVFIADNVGVDITSLVAGLSIGGLALALAAQDAVRNLFGSLLVILDQPFTVGDWVKIGDVEGT